MAAFWWSLLLFCPILGPIPIAIYIMLLYSISLITYPRSVFGFGTQRSSGKTQAQGYMYLISVWLVIHAYHIYKDMIWRPDISLFGGDNIESQGGCHITHLCGGRQIKFTRRPPYHFIWWLPCNSITSLWGCHIIQLYGSCNIKLCGGQNIVTWIMLWWQLSHKCETRCGITGSTSG